MDAVRRVGRSRRSLPPQAVGARRTSPSGRRSGRFVARGRASYFFLEDIHVSPHVVLDPKSITLEEIVAEENIERRRILIDRFGIERYLEGIDAKIIHADETGTLWQENIEEVERWRRERQLAPLTVVEVVNCTPEKDGGRRHYFLRVPPTMTKAREAVAWTFGLESDEYWPIMET